VSEVEISLDILHVCIYTAESCVTEVDYLTGVGSFFSFFSESIRLSPRSGVEHNAETEKLRVYTYAYKSMMERKREVVFSRGQKIRYKNII